MSSLSAGFLDVPAPVFFLNGGEIGEGLVNGLLAGIRPAELTHHLFVCKGSFAQGIQYAELALDNQFRERVAGLFRGVEVEIHFAVVHVCELLGSRGFLRFLFTYIGRLVRAVGGKIDGQALVER